MQNKKTVIILSVILAVLIALAAIAIFAPKKSAEGEKNITVEIISAVDEYSFSKQYKTDAAFLGDLLEAEGLVGFETSVYGRYITSAGGFSERPAEGYYWMVRENGEYTSAGIDSTAITDGAVYTISLEKYSE